MDVSLDNIVSISEIQKNYRRIFNKAKRSKESIIVMKGNEPEVAIVDVKVLKLLEEKAKEAELNVALEAIRIGEEEGKKGKLRTLKLGGLVELANED